MVKMSKNAIFIILLLGSCRSLKIIEEPRVINLRMIAHYNDSCGDLCSRFVFSSLPCDSIRLKNKAGKLLPLIKAGTRYDSACFTCEEFLLNSAIINTVSFSNTDYFYQIYVNGELTIHNSKCSKLPVNLLTGYPDSGKSIVLWNKLDYKTGRFTFYRAIEAYLPPYYNAGRVDSFSYDLRHFCTSDEKDEERQNWQKFYDKTVIVKTTPNPFEESFEFTLTTESFAGGLLKPHEITLTFYDDKSSPLISKIIELQKSYVFTFPDIMHGKTIYYRVKWSDYAIGGQMVKI
jgi:hypothetical protein